MDKEDKKIRKILLEAVDIERWASKSDKTYSFLEDCEKTDIVERILNKLKVKGYFINKIK